MVDNLKNITNNVKIIWLGWISTSYFFSVLNSTTLKLDFAAIQFLDLAGFTFPCQPKWIIVERVERGCEGEQGKM